MDEKEETTKTETDVKNEPKIETGKLKRAEEDYQITGRRTSEKELKK